MVWVDLVTLLAVLQFFSFGILVGKARSKHHLPAPAMVGNPLVERYIRVHLNTLELLAFFLPSLWIAARYWGGYWTAGLGVIYLVGRFVYLRAYVQAPEKRHLGYGLSVGPVFILFLLGLIGVVRSLF